MEDALAQLAKFLPAMVDSYSVDYPEFPTVELTDEDELQRRGRIYRHEHDGPGDAWLLEAAADSCRLSFRFVNPKPCLLEILRRLSASAEIKSLRKTPLKGYHCTFIFCASETFAPAAELRRLKETLRDLEISAEKVEADSIEFIKRRAKLI